MFSPRHASRVFTQRAVCTASSSAFRPRSGDAEGAIVVGVGSYVADEYHDLPSAIEDARLMTELFRDTLRIPVLRHVENPTKETLREEVNELVVKIKSSRARHDMVQEPAAKSIRVSRDGSASAVLLFFAGHGRERERGLELLCTNSSRSGAKEDVLLEDLMQIFMEIWTERTVIVAFLDCCRDPDGIEQNRGDERGPLRKRKQMRLGPGGYVIAHACRLGSPAWNGVFTKALSDHMQTPNINLINLLERVWESARSSHNFQRPETLMGSELATKIKLLRSPLHNVPDLSCEMIGREGALNEACDHLDGAVPATCVLLHGSRGVGKTLFMHALLLRVICFFDIVWLVRASDTYGIQSGLQGLAQDLGLVGDGVSAQDAVNILKEWLLQEDFRWLLALDDVHDVQELLAALPPHVLSRGSIVLASTNQRVIIDGFACATFRLADRLQRTDSMKLLGSVSGIRNDENGAGKIAELLYDHPQALQACGEYVRNFGVPYSGYVDKISEHGVRSTPLSNVVQVAVSTIKRTMEGSDLAVRLLQCMSLVRSHSVSYDVIRKMLRGLAGAQYNVNIVHECLKHLQHSGLVVFQEPSDYEVPSIFMQILQEELEEDRANFQSLIEITLQALLSGFESAWTVLSTEAWLYVAGPHLKHIVELVRHHRGNRTLNFLCLRSKIALAEYLVTSEFLWEPAQTMISEELANIQERERSWFLCRRRNVSTGVSDFVLAAYYLARSDVLHASRAQSEATEVYCTMLTAWQYVDHSASGSLARTTTDADVHALSIIINSWLLLFSSRHEIEEHHVKQSRADWLSSTPSTKFKHVERVREYVLGCWFSCEGADYHKAGHHFEEALKILRELEHEQRQTSTVHRVQRLRSTVLSSLAEHLQRTGQGELALERSSEAITIMKQECFKGDPKLRRRLLTHGKLVAGRAACQTDWQQALHIFQEALQVKDRGQWSSARQTFDETDADVLFWISTAYHKIGEMEASCEGFEKLVERGVQPDMTPKQLRRTVLSWTRLASCQIAMGRSDDARQTVELVQKALAGRETESECDLEFQQVLEAVEALSRPAPSA